MAIIAQDNFDRANSSTTLGVTPVGNFTWLKYGTQQWGIQSNLAYPVTRLYDSPTYIDVGISDNVAYQITQTVYSVGNQLMWRIQNQTNFFLLEEVGVYSCINGVYVELGNIGTLANGSVVRIELRGTEHKIFVDGQLRVTFNHNSFLTATKYGFSCNSTTARYDDVLIETFTTLVEDTSSLATFSATSPPNNTVITSNSQTISSVINDADGDVNDVFLEVSGTQDFTTLSRSMGLTSIASGGTANFNVTGLPQGNSYWRMRARKVETLTYTPYTPVRGIFANIAPTGKLNPEALLTQTGYTGIVENISEGVDTPDGNWLTTITTPTTNTVMQASFPSPPRALATGAGLQAFRVRVRKNKTNSSSGTMTIGVYENNVLRGTAQSFPVDGSTTVLTFNWDASLLSAIDGSNVEIRLTGNGYTGLSGTTRFGIEIGAVEWVYQLTTQTQVNAPSDGSDSIPPANVTNLTATKTTNSVTLNWTNPADSDFSHVRILRDGVQIVANQAGTTYTDSGRTPNTTHNYSVVAVDTTGNAASGTTLSVTTNPIDSTPPANVTGLTSTRTTTSVTLNWTNPTDSDFSHVRISRNGTQIVANQTGTTYTDGGRTPSTTYTYLVVSVDTSGNASTGTSLSVTTSSPDTIPPSNVTGVSKIEDLSTIALSWINPIDSDFSHVKILRNGTELANAVVGTSYLDGGLTASTEYTYLIKSVDQSGNESVGTSIVATTLAPPSLTTPFITKIEVEREKISPAPTMDMSVISFAFDKDVTEWTVNVLGADPFTGTVADSGGAVSKGETIYAVVDWTELYQEGVNRVNIYGKNVDGLWTPYNSGNYIEGGDFTTSTYDTVYSGGAFTDTTFERTLDGSVDRVILKKGYKLTLSNLSEGELGFCIDTKELFIGSNSGNILLKPASGEVITPPPVEGSLSNVTNLQTSLVDGASVKLTWTNAPSATSYDVKVNGNVVANVSSTPYITDVLPVSTHSFTVVAKNSMETASGVSVNATTQARTKPVYPTSLITTQGDIFVDYNMNNNTLRLSTDHGKTYTSPIPKPFTGALRFVHAFTDGTIVIFSENKAYYTTDFVTFTQSTILDTSGNPIVMTGNDKFYTTGYDLRTQIVNGIEMLVWGNYTTESGVEWSTNVVIWYTRDKGATIKMAMRLNTPQTYPSRHIHTIVQNPKDQSFWVASGDDTTTSDWMRKGVYNTTTDTWSWSVIGTGREFKWGALDFIGDYVYWAWDVPSGGICRSLVSEVSDITKHTKIFTTTNDAISLCISQRGEMIIGQSIYGGTDRADKIWYSPDRVNFTMVDAPFFTGVSNRIGVWAAMRMTSEGKLSSGIWGEEIYWELQPRVFLDDFVKDAGFVNAFKGIGTENIVVGEVTNVTSSSTRNSVTLSWTKPNNSYLNDVQILRNGVVVAKNILNQTYTNTGLSAGTNYTYTIQTVDITGKISEGVVRAVTTAP